MVEVIKVVAEILITLHHSHLNQNYITLKSIKVDLKINYDNKKIKYNLVNFLPAIWQCAG